MALRRVSLKAHFWREFWPRDLPGRAWVDYWPSRLLTWCQVLRVSHSDTHHVPSGSRIGRIQSDRSGDGRRQMSPRLAARQAPPSSTVGVWPPKTLVDRERYRSLINTLIAISQIHHAPEGDRGAAPDHIRIPQETGIRMLNTSTNPRTTPIAARRAIFCQERSKVRSAF